MSTPRGFLIAGTHSGVGKTSMALGLMGALRRRGHPVAPFKVGPDYIDPTYHTSVSGRQSRNLDTWLMPPSEAAGIFYRAVADLGQHGEAHRRPRGAQAPVAVVEGVMGLFDGRAGGGERCSTAEMAKLLDLPVILVVDCSHMARSAAAVVHGFSTFDPDLQVAGVILNKVAGDSHAEMVAEALAGGLPIVGVVPRRSDLQLGSRHLGLIPTVENAAIAEVLERIIDHVAEHVDIDALLGLARPVPAVTPARTEKPPTPHSRVAVARDEAFSFYYHDNLEVLEEEGADLVFFSPVAGERLPACDALYLGGGYPEVYGEALAANVGLREDLRRAAADGLRIYAECGGYLYLGGEIEYESRRFGMAGLLPTSTTLADKRLRMGYIEAVPTAANPLGKAGVELVRGHLFHYSSTAGSDAPAYHVAHKGDTIADGWTDGSIVASYVHLHFRGSRAVARWLAGDHRGGTIHD